MSSTSTALPHARGAPTEPLRLGGIVVLSLGALDFGLEQSLIIPALPALAEHYGASLDAIAWMVTGFVLASIVAIPLVGRLGDMFGKRRMRSRHWSRSPSGRSCARSRSRAGSPSRAGSSRASGQP